jgi:antitoxin YefM
MISTTLTDFRKEMKSYLDKITDENETVIINRGKDKGVVLISMDEYNAKEINQNSHRSYTDLSEAEKTSIKQGIDDANAGKVTPHKEVIKKVFG